MKLLADIEDLRGSISELRGSRSLKAPSVIRIEYDADRGRLRISAGDRVPASRYRKFVQVEASILAAKDSRDCEIQVARMLANALGGDGEWQEELEEEPCRHRRRGRGRRTSR